MKATRKRYGVVGFAVTLAMLAYMQRVAISQAAGPIAQDLHLDSAELGAVFGAFGLAYALFEIPMGTLGDRLGVRRILTQIVLLWSAFTAATGLAWNVTSMWIVRFAFGAGEAGCFPNLTKMLTAWLPQSERTKAQALMWACTRWAGALTPPLALLAITLVGWRWAFVLFGVIGVTWLFFFRRFYTNDPADHKGVNAEELKLLEDSRAIVNDHRVRWGKLFVKPEVIVLAIQYFFFSFVWYFYVTWLPTYLVEAWHLSAIEAAGYSVIPLAFGGFGSLISGFLPVRIPRRWIAFCGFSATAILFLAITQLHNVTLVMIAMGFASFSSDLTMPISWNACAEIGRRYTATVAAAMNMFGNFAGFVAPTVSGIILQRTGGDWDELIYIMAVAAAISASAWLYLDPDEIARRNATANTGDATTTGTP